MKKDPSQPWILGSAAQRLAVNVTVVFPYGDKLLLSLPGTGQGNGKKT